MSLDCHIIALVQQASWWNIDCRLTLTQLSLNCLSTVTRLLFDCHMTVARLLFDCRSTVARLLLDCRSTVAWLSLDCRSTVARLTQLSLNCHLTSILALVQQATGWDMFMKSQTLTNDHCAICAAISPIHYYYFPTIYTISPTSFFNKKCHNFTSTILLWNTCVDFFY